MKTLCMGLALTQIVIAGLARADDLPWYTERRIIGTSELEPIESVLGTDYYKDAQPVARLETTDGTGFCTSVRVGRDLFLTNYHCFDYKPCDSVQFHLGFERGLAAESQLVLKCNAVLSKNVTYDYALYRVDLNGATPRVTPGDGNLTVDGGGVALAPSADTFPVATLWTGPVAVGQLLIVPGHPAARFKEIDRGAKCKLRTIAPELIEERQTITHTCDTEGGSSGSPLMDRTTGFVVALHWGGREDYNMAIPLAEIVPDVQRNVSPDVFGELQIRDR